jgi:hypothetical protein
MGLDHNGCGEIFSCVGWWVWPWTTNSYLSQGRTILQPHHLIDELNIAIEENKDTFIEEGPFAKLIRNSQVDLLKNPNSLTSFCVPNILKTHFLSISLETFQQFQLQKKFQSF